MLVLGTLLACTLPACGSDGSNGSKPASSGGSGNAGDGSGGSGDPGGGCHVTFGGDAASVKATSCSVLGPFVSDSTSFEFDGDATGIDSPLYGFGFKLPNGVSAKTYETNDLYYASSSVGVTSTGKNYYLDFDSRDATKSRHGSAKIVMTGPEHGTADLTLDSDDTPPAQATVHIEF